MADVISLYVRQNIIMNVCSVYLNSTSLIHFRRLQSWARSDYKKQNFLIFIFLLIGENFKRMDENHS